MSYGSLSLFYGGLESLLGAPKMLKGRDASTAASHAPSLMNAIEHEHKYALPLYVHISPAISRHPQRFILTILAPALAFDLAPISLRPRPISSQSRPDLAPISQIRKGFRARLHLL